MSTIINNPPGIATDDSAGMGIAVVVILLLVVAAGALFVMYGLPTLRDTTPATPNTTNIKVEIPKTPTPIPAP